MNLILQGEDSFTAIHVTFGMTRSENKFWLTDSRIILSSNQSMIEISKLPSAEVQAVDGLGIVVHWYNVNGLPFVYW